MATQYLGTGFDTPTSGMQKPMYDAYRGWQKQGPGYNPTDSYMDGMSRFDQISNWISPFTTSPQAMAARKKKDKNLMVNPMMGQYSLLPGTNMQAASAPNQPMYMPDMTPTLSYEQFNPTGDPRFAGTYSGQNYVDYIDTINANDAAMSAPPVSQAAPAKPYAVGDNFGQHFLKTGEFGTNGAREFEALTGTPVDQAALQNLKKKDRQAYLDMILNKPTPAPVKNGIMKAPTSARKY